MQIIPRVTTTAIFEMIEDKLQVNDEYNREQLVEHFSNMLQGAPDQILITAAIDGDEVVAFLISLAVPNNPTVFIAQAWSKSGLDPLVTATGFSICLRWCKQLGRKRVKCETMRGSGMCKKWGFKPYSEILAFDIPDGMNPSEVIDRLVPRKPKQEDGPMGGPMGPMYPIDNQQETE